MKGRFKSLFSLIRIYQWPKNLFVLSGFLFSGQLTDVTLLSKSLFGMLAFCFVSSCVYVLNDVKDLEYDIQHPVKRLRPLASNVFNLKEAYTVASGLALLGIAMSLSLGVSFFACIFAYLILNHFYTFKFKYMALLDVFCIALGFILRVLAGSVGLSIPPSHWLLVCTLMISLFLGFAKRYAEMSLHASKVQRDSLKDYSPVLLQIYLGISAACAIMSYGLYTISPRTILTHHNSHMVITLPVVIFGIFRYLQLLLTHNQGEDPGKTLFYDPYMRITIIIYCITVLIILW